MPADRSLPIGVFDSGVGGLTVVRALMERLPLENIVYFGDTARVPYGIKSVATIGHYTGQITDFLMARGVKMLIVACNTMAAVAGDVVRAKAGGVPVLDVIGGFLFGFMLFLGSVAAVFLLALAFGCHLLTPAVAVEDADAFDAVSRSFSYLV
nr:hypothetical protein [Denitromonas sp.]